MTAHRIAGRAREGLDVARAHPRHVVLFAAVAGLLCGGWAPAWVALPALAALVVAGAPGPALLAVVAVLGGAGVAQARVHAIDTGTLPARIGAPLATRMVLLDPLHARASGQLVARAAATAGPARGEPLLLRLEDRSRLHGRVDPGDVDRKSVV